LILLPLSYPPSATTRYCVRGGGRHDGELALVSVSVLVSVLVAASSFHTLRANCPKLSSRSSSTSSSSSSSSSPRPPAPPSIVPLIQSDPHTSSNALRSVPGRWIHRDPPRQQTRPRHERRSPSHSHHHMSHPVSPASLTTAPGAETRSISAIPSSYSRYDFRSSFPLPSSFRPQ